MTRHWRRLLLVGVGCAAFLGGIPGCATSDRDTSRRQEMTDSDADRAEAALRRQQQENEAQRQPYRPPRDRPVDQPRVQPTR